MSQENQNNDENNSNAKKRKIQRALRLFLWRAVHDAILGLEAVEVPEGIVHRYYDLFMNDTYDKIKSVKSDFNRSFVIKAAYLKELISKNPAAKYVKMTIVQLPQDFKPSIENKEMEGYGNDLYFFFALANSSHDEPLIDYYDLNAFNDQMIQIHKDDVKYCLKEFHDISKKSSIRKILLDVVPDNTETIYINIDQLLNDYFIRPELKEMENIALVFCQIDEFDTEIISRGLSDLVKDNHKHFGCLWFGIQADGRIIQGAPVYDFNYLCPNQCV